MKINSLLAFFGLTISTVFFVTACHTHLLAQGGNWHNCGGQNYVAMDVYTSAVDAAGFLHVGGSGGIKKWDGADWTDVVAASEVNGTIYEIKFDASGNMYAGGAFTTIDGVSANRIAKWDGSTWSALGSGMNGQVWTITFDNSGNVLAGGNFTTSGGSSANRIAKWDGTSWSTFGTGANGNVESLAFDNSGTLYVGGWFTSIAGVTANRIAKWDGSTWSAMGSGANNGVNVVLPDASGNVYAGGYFGTMGGITVNCVAKWNGSAWSAMGSGFNGSVPFAYTMEFNSSGQLVVGGGFFITGVGANIVKWTGSNWASLGSAAYSTSDNVYTISKNTSGDIFVGGIFVNAYTNSNSGLYTLKVAKFDGSTWVPMGNGVYGYGVYSTAVDASGNIYAAGDFHYIGAPAGALRVAKWDGSTWTTIATLTAAGLVNDIAFDNGGNLIAVGGFTAINGVSASYAAKWNGSSWSAMPGLTQENHTVWVTQSGTIYSISQLSPYRLSQWNGSAWTTFATANNIIYDMTSDGAGNIYLSGTFTSVGGVSANSVAKWNGSNWSALGSGPAAFARVIAIDPNGDVVVAGANWGGSTGIQKWNGSTWSNIGNIDFNGIESMLIIGSSIYVGGLFTIQINSQTVRYFAHWDGSSWINMNTGIYNGGTSYRVRTITAANGNLFIGGTFYGENFDCIGYYDNVPAPITLLSFTAQKHPRHPDQSLLRFSTASERDNAGFDIERSPDGNKWAKIGYVVGHGTTAEQRDYDFTDSQPLSGRNYYRLRQTDYDGSFEYSPVASVFFETGTITVTVSPNPVADYLMLQPVLEEEVQVNIFDQNGGLVLSEILPEHENRVEVTRLLSGVYVAKWQTSTQQQVIRFVKQ